MSKNDKEITVNNILSLYDEQYSISNLHSQLEKADKEANSVIDSAKDAVHRVLTQEYHSEEHYVVDPGDELKKKIDNGDVQLVRKKSGEILAQIRDKDGHLGKRLPIKKELEESGITGDQLEMALKMEAIKSQLDHIIDTLEVIEKQVKDVVTGQMNDRIGLYYSGLSLYVESKSIQDISLKKLLIAQAIKSLNDANSQLIQDIRSNIEYLLNGDYNSEKSKTKDIKKHLSRIQQSYSIVYRASFIKAMIYQENHEIGGMLTSIEEYGRFVEKLIVPYVGKLSEFDNSNMLIDDSSWSNIAKTLTGCRKIQNQLAGCDKFVLTEGGVKYGD